jgi:hypothetical protein
MADVRLQRLAAYAVVLLLLGCGNEQGTDKGASKADASARKAVEAKPPPYSYAAPVKGHIKETNIGEFDLVDGIAYPSMSGAGTVIYVASKPIASPTLVDSACPLTQARALSKLRNASFGEITLDPAGRSKYFAAGTPFGGSLTDLTPRDWSSTLKADPGRAAGSVTHKQYGKFDFDLPLSNPKVDQISEGDRQQKRKLAATTPKPGAPAISAAYVALRDAALKKDLKATLAALGFDARQSAAIRGMTASMPTFSSSLIAS